MKVTPWDVEGNIDYDRLAREFGTSIIDEKTKARLEKGAKGDLPAFLRRGYFFSHRDLDKVLEDHEKGKGFFVYTGRGPSNKMHIGHLPSFMLAKWLQEKFDINVYIEMTDDEKFLFNRDLTLKQVDDYANDNILDIAALGFDPDKTFIFKDIEFVKNVYPMLLKVSRKITFSTAKAVFGFTNETNTGMIFYPSYQVVPTLFEKKRCLIPNAIDQDPYWRIQRDMAESLGYFRTAAIHSKFLPPLSGMEGKMSASKGETAIWLDDDEKTVRNKVMKYAFSGGQPTVEEHRKLGGNPDVDVSFQWLYLIFEEDDERIEKIREDYRAGRILSGEMKQLLVDRLNGFLKVHKENKARAKPLAEKMMYSGKLASRMWKTTFGKDE
jgi:tryptophanyl-tRNA synthetase